MAKGSRGRRRIASRQCRLAPYPLPSCDRNMTEDLCPKKCPKALDEDWTDATCSVCMECPHNAVLLLCSSHEKGCRPYMCGTSYRYSNCLDQYKNASTKVMSSNAPAENPIPGSDSRWSFEKFEATELACPLCRGKVKGWTVVEPAREYLNAKKRSCMQDDCSFVGTYKELRKHMRTDHPSAQPRAVDPSLEQKWRRLERERDHDDVLSTIRSSMPGAMVFGDYVIEGNHYGFDSNEEDGGLDDDAGEGSGGFDVGFSRNLVNVFLLLHALGPSGDDVGRRLRQAERTVYGTTNDSSVSNPSLGSLGESGVDDSDDSDGNGGDVSLASRLRRHGRVLLGRSGRRRRRREGTGGQR